MNSGATSQLIQWIPMLLFFALFIAVLFGEIWWLKGKGWATAGKAAAFVCLSDFLSFAIGSFIVFIILLVMFMAVMGPAGRGSDTGDGFYIAAISLAVIIPPVLLFLLKRVLLAVLKIKSGKAAWTYSLLSSLLILTVCLIPPPLAFYILYSIWK